MPSVMYSQMGWILIRERTRTRIVEMGSEAQHQDWAYILHESIGTRDICLRMMLVETSGTKDFGDRFCTLCKGAAEIEQDTSGQ
jgi:hypothetical protein